MPLHALCGKKNLPLRTQSYTDKEIKLDAGYRIDLLVENKVIIEIKSVDAIADIHKAQLMTYMKLANIKLGLLINFNVTRLKDGIVRWII